MEENRKDSTIVNSTEMGINEDKKYETMPGSAGIITPDKYGEDKSQVPAIEVDSNKGESLVTDPVGAVDQKGRPVEEPER